MYVHIGHDKTVRKKDILGIFDIDSSTVSVNTRKYLKMAEKEKRVFTLGYDLPRSFVIMKDKRVYLSPYNSPSIK